MKKYIIITSLFIIFNSFTYKPHFKLSYTGLGFEHMNINLPNLSFAGIKEGDEIGVFDSIYCVGTKIITKQVINDNCISIPSSANDTIKNFPNGFIEGHKIKLKLYRDNTVYILYYQPVNIKGYPINNNTFEKRESMFAIIDFLKSTIEK